MKKTIIALIVMMMCIAGCGSSPKASGSDDLDATIREASDYLNGNLPAKSKIVILNVQSDSAALSNYIIDELIANAVNDRNFEVVDRQQLDLIRAEQNFQYSGEVDDNDALSIGKFFGAQVIVSGRVSQVGDRYRFTIRALEVQTARVQGQNNWNMNAGATITALLKGGGSGGSATTSGTSGRQAATPARPTAPKNGTYTFYPRLRAIQGAVESRAYLDRIVVRNGNLAVYLFDTPIGKGNGPGNPWVGTGSGGVILQDLDNPRRTWNIVSQDIYVDGYGVGGSLITFEGVTGRRFTLNSGTGYGNVAMIFEEIILDEPDE